MANRYLISTFAWLLAMMSAAQAADIASDVIGAGASFPAPAMEAWGQRYAQQSGVRLSYRSVGSSEGIRRLTARSVDFAMTDVPMTLAELKQDDLLQFPIVAGAIVPVVNVPGIGDGQLKLSGTVLADIFLGKITRWNTPAIKDLNTDRDLPDLPITVVHRSDGSGTTFVFTYYLSRVSAQWQERPGIASRLHWPAGIGVTGNEGVSSTVHDTPGAIGYVESAYATQYHLPTVQLRNASGQFSRASDTGVRAALASANWTRPGFYEVPVNRNGDQSWPIVGISFALVHKIQEDRADAVATLKLLQWIYQQGAQGLQGLQYVTLDDVDLVRRFESTWAQIRDDKDHPVWTTK